MEANFCYNLGLEDFAKLTHRSLSTFNLFRDIQAARYHPLPENEQSRFSGEYLLRE
jgi:hypothetical protein